MSLLSTRDRKEPDIHNNYNTMELPEATIQTSRVINGVEISTNTLSVKGHTLLECIEGVKILKRISNGETTRE